MKKKFCRDVLSLAFTALLFLQAPAQLKALKVGEAIPEEVWTTPLQLVNSPQKTTDLSADRDKLILLDFWATWCSACLKGFPKMEKLQEQYGKRLKIVAVSGQDRATLEKFYASKNGQRYKGVSSVSGDLLFKKLFPHVGVPFIVWIKDGKLVNTTDAEQVTAENIRKVLGGDAAALQTVVQRDEDGPLMLSKDISLEKGFALSHYTFFGKGRMRGLGSGTRFHQDGNVTYGRQFTNLSIAEMYAAIANEIFRERGDMYSKKRRITEVKDLQSFINPKRADGSYEDSHMYSFDFIVPRTQVDSLYTAMLTNLNLLSDYTATIEKRTVPCLVLVRTSVNDKFAAKGDPAEFALNAARAIVKNSTMYNVVNSLNGLYETALPIVDGTGYTSPVDLQLGAISTVDQLRKELSRYDLELVERQRPLDMLVIRDKIR